MWARSSPYRFLVRRFYNSCNRPVLVQAAGNSQKSVVDANQTRNVCAPQVAIMAWRSPVGGRGVFEGPRQSDPKRRGTAFGGHPRSKMTDPTDCRWRTCFALTSAAVSRPSGTRLAGEDDWHLQPKTVFLLPATAVWHHDGPRLLTPGRPRCHQGEC